MTSLAVFALNATADLGRAIAQELWVSLAPHEEREFEDGEHKARPLDSVDGVDAYVIQSLHSRPRARPTSCAASCSSLARSRTRAPPG